MTKRIIDFILFFIYNYIGDNMKYVIIKVAFDNIDLLNKTKVHLLSDKLIAAAQVSRINSTWRWKGKLETSMEYMLELKTKKQHIDEIYNIIRKYHNYDCFEFTYYEVNCSEDYYKWIEEEVK